MLIDGKKDFSDKKNYTGCAKKTKILWLTCNFLAQILAQPLLCACTVIIWTRTLRGLSRCHWNGIWSILSVHFSHIFDYVMLNIDKKGDFTENEQSLTNSSEIRSIPPNFFFKCENYHYSRFQTTFTFQILRKIEWMRPFLSDTSFFKNVWFGGIYYTINNKIMVSLDDMKLLIVGPNINRFWKVNMLWNAREIL